MNALAYCSHKNNTILAATNCPTCHKPDFRKKLCKDCGYGPYTDTGICPGHLGGYVHAEELAQVRRVLATGTKD